MEFRVLKSKKFEHPLICFNCGARLPVEIDVREGAGEISVFCKHCKAVTVVRIGKR